MHDDNKNGGGGGMIVSWIRHFLADQATQFLISTDRGSGQTTAHKKTRRVLQPQEKMDA